MVAGLTARKAVRSGVIWGYIFGIAIASSAISYTTIYKTQAQRDALAAAYGSNKATSALFGPAPELQTVAGFTVFKISMTLMVLGAVWGLLTSTRLLRGEEDSGRWELLLAGQTTRKGAAVQALGGLGRRRLRAVGAHRRDHGPHRPGLEGGHRRRSGPLLRPGHGGDGGDVPGRRRAHQPARRDPAPGRLLCRGVPRCRLRRADDRRRRRGPPRPDLGVAARLGGGAPTADRPPTPGPRADRRRSPRVLAVLAVRLAGSRDVGASIVPDRATSQPHLRLLSGPTGLAVRMVRPTVIGWWVAIAVSGLLYGLIAKSAGATISGSSVRKVFSKLGAPGTGADAVLGVCFPHPGRPGGLRRRRPGHRGAVGGVRRQARPPPGPSGLSYIVARRQARRRRRRAPGERRAVRGSSPGSAPPASTPG